MLTPGMDVKFGVTTRRIDTAIPTGAETLPTAKLWRNNVESAVAVTVASTARAGQYLISFTIPSGWAANDWIQVWFDASVNGIPDYVPVLTGVLGTSSGGGGTVSVSTVF